MGSRLGCAWTSPWPGESQSGRANLCKKIETTIATRAPLVEYRTAAGNKKAYRVVRGVMQARPALHNRYKRVSMVRGTFTNHRCISRPTTGFATPTPRSLAAPDGWTLNPKEPRVGAPHGMGKRQCARRRNGRQRGKLPPERPAEISGHSGSCLRLRQRCAPRSERREGARRACGHVAHGNIDGLLRGARRGCKREA